MTRSTRTAVLIAAIAMTLPALAACSSDDDADRHNPSADERCAITDISISDDDEDGADHLAACLDELNEVVSADVGVTEADSDYFIGSIRVEIADDASQADFVAALDGVEAATKQMHMETTYSLVFAGEAGQETAGGAQSNEVETHPLLPTAERVALLYRARKSVTSATARIEGDILALYTHGTGLDDVSSTARAVARDPRLRHASTAVSTEDTGSYPVGYHLSAEGLDQRVVRNWSAVLDAVGRLDSTIRPDSLYARFGPETRIELVLDTPAWATVPTIAEGRSQLWPTTRRLLDLTWSQGQTHELAVRVADGFLVHIASNPDEFTHIDSKAWHRLARRHVGM